MAVYTRRYVQYNDLPFDNYEMLRSWDDTTVKFKQESSSYTFKHGSYVAFKSEEMLVEATSVSMSILFELRRLPCDKRVMYRKEILDKISKPGKLWAIQNGELVWAYAYPSNYSEAASVSIADSFMVDIDFTLYEGIWHKANAYTTFLEEYDLCEDMEYKKTTDQCKEYLERKNFNCCNDCLPDLKPSKGKCECECKAEEKDFCGCAVCTDYTRECKCTPPGTTTLFEDDCCGCRKNRKNLCDVDIASVFYGVSGCSTTGYKIVEDCSSYTNETGEPIGTKVRGEACNNYMSTKVYANTDVDTTDYEIVVTGVFHNLYVEVNGNGNVIEGDYEGSLKIRGDGTAWILNDCGWSELPASVITIPEGNELGYTFHHGWNNFKVDAGDCNCVKTLTAYINIDNITY